MEEKKKNFVFMQHIYQKKIIEKKRKNISPKLKTPYCTFREKRKISQLINKADKQKEIAITCPD